MTIPSLFRQQSGRRPLPSAPKTSSRKSAITSAASRLSSAPRSPSHTSSRRNPKPNTEARHSTSSFPRRPPPQLKTTTEERHRSLFKVPVFQADCNSTPHSTSPALPPQHPKARQLDWSRCRTRRRRQRRTRSTRRRHPHHSMEKPPHFDPAEICPHILLSAAIQSNDSSSRSSARTPVAVQPGKPIRSTQGLIFPALLRRATHRPARLRQEQRTSPCRATGPIPASMAASSPSTAPSRPPASTADWSVPFIARGVPAEGAGEIFSNLDATALGVSFIEVADPYQSVNRSRSNTYCSSSA